MAAAGYDLRKGGRGRGIRNAATLGFSARRRFFNNVLESFVGASWPLFITGTGKGPKWDGADKMKPTASGLHAAPAFAFHIVKRAAQDMAAIRHHHSSAAESWSLLGGDGGGGGAGAHSTGCCFGSPCGR